MRKHSTALLALLLAALGCSGEGKAKKAGQAVGETVTDFAKGIGSGIDKRLEVEVDLSPRVSGLGLSRTVAKAAGIDSQGKGITVYMLSQKAVAGSLVAKALNSEGTEIGRSVVDIDFAEDDAQYITFQFDAQMDTQLVRRYTIDIKASSTP
ncbi:MAG TPA: hypothetical protein VF278_01240 [Pirellulales bacterium]